jgi:hypothetical protein
MIKICAAQLSQLTPSTEQEWVRAKCKCCGEDILVEHLAGITKGGDCYCDKELCLIALAVCTKQGQEWPNHAINQEPLPTESLIHPVKGEEKGVGTLETLRSCRDHWKVSFEHERANVVRLRQIVYKLHPHDCICRDCALVEGKPRPTE